VTRGANPGGMSIGEVAQAAGLTASAIRYYERRALVQPTRRVAGRRVFEPSAVNRLRAIAIAQEAGFSLEEIHQLLGAKGRRWQPIVAGKLGEVRDLIERLEVLARVLEEALECGCDALDRCPLIEARATTRKLPKVSTQRKRGIDNAPQLRLP
jgi:DNA-binding transcriptional MerR regulator